MLTHICSLALYIHVYIYICTHTHACTHTQIYIYTRNIYESMQISVHHPASRNEPNDGHYVTIHSKSANATYAITIITEMMDSCVNLGQVFPLKL